ncbi:MAG: hypothetical protein QM753_14290 [Thermomicrobiales bacterium]
MIATTERPALRTIELRSVSVGMPALLGTNRQGEVISGIRKRPVVGDEIFVGRTDLAGDGQADLRAHGVSTRRSIATPPITSPGGQWSTGMGGSPAKPRSGRTSPLLAFWRRR